jgi:Flp pilus assembly protein TadG
VETAVVLPLIVALILGAMDLGQFANCHQKISDVCREGARCAVQFETTDTAAVDAVVFACLMDVFPGVPEAILRSNAVVTVRDQTGSPISGSALGATNTGSPVSVEVTLQFDSVRWINGPQFLANRTVQAATIMRRE